MNNHYLINCVEDNIPNSSEKGVRNHIITFVENTLSLSKPFVESSNVVPCDGAESNRGPTLSFSTLPLLVPRSSEGAFGLLRK